MEAKVITSNIANMIVKRSMHRLYKSVHYSCLLSAHLWPTLLEATREITSRTRKLMGFS